MNGHHVTHYLVGIAALATATFGVLHKPPLQVINAPGFISSRAATRAAATEWPELTQPQIDALTEKARAINPKPVLIFCKDGCRDLALDLDDAFESAHVKSQIETPLIQDTVGLMATSEALARAIRETTGLEVTTFKLGDPRADDHEAIVIGSKPRG